MLRQIGHLASYDIRALRRPLAVWGLALACETAILLLGPDRLGADPRLPISYDFGALIVRFSLTAVLGALLVQGDALVGTTAFWRTRPIPRWSLFTSKVSSAIALLIVIPTLLVFGVLLLLGLPAASAARGARVVAAEEAVLLTFVLAAAAVTANLAHFVIASLAGFTLVALSTAFLPVLLLAWPDLRVGMLAWNRPFFMTVAVLGAVAGIAHQFLTLRTTRSVAVIALALLVATGGANLWRRGPGATPARAVDPAVLAASDVRVELEPIGWGQFTRLRGGVRQHGWQLSTSVNVSGEPAAILLRPVSMDSTLAIGGRSVVRWQSAAASGVVSAGRPPDERSQPYRSIRVALGGVELVLPRNVLDQKHRLALIETGEDTYGLLQDSTGTLDATLTLRAFRYAVTARSAAAPGGTLRMRDRRATVVAIGAPLPVAGMELPREGLNLTLRDTDVTSFGAFTFGTPPSYYILINASRRQAVFATPHTQRMFRATLGLLGALSPQVRTGSLQLEYDPAQNDASFDVDDEWMRRAELLRLEPEDLGVVTRPLHIEGLRTERPKTGAKGPHA